MPITISSGTVILATVTTAIASTATDIIGLGSDGYGLTTYTSFPTRAGNRISQNQLQGIFRDLNTITQHVSGQFTTTIVITTGSLITTSTFSDLWRLKEYVSMARYTLHPSQRSTYTGTSGSVEDIWLQNSTSTRSQLWPTTPVAWTTSTITHRTRVQWVTTSLAQYFFNSGGDLVFKPYWTTGTGAMSTSSSTFKLIDNAWARFVNTGQSFVTDWTYRRSDYVNYVTTSRSWGSASTLSVTVTAVKVDGRTIDFAVDYSTYVSGGIWYDDAVTVISQPPVVIDNVTNSFDSSGDPNPSIDLQGGDGIGDGIGDGAGGGGGAKVICTELYHQGLLDRDIYLLDQQFGRWLLINDPQTYWGYRAWADILVRYMRGQGRPIIPKLLFWQSEQQQQILSQRLAQWIARKLAEPFAYELARRVDGQTRPFRLSGYLVVSVGLPICRLIGRFGLKGKSHVV